MAEYIKNKPIQLAAKYNIDTTDDLVDFNLAKLASEEKVEVEVLIVPPTISGAQDFELLVDSEAPDWGEGVTAYDEQWGNLTSEIVINHSDVNLAVPGDYDLIFTVEDPQGNEAEVTVNVHVYEEHTVTLDLDDGTLEGYTEPFDVRDGVTYGDILSAFEEDPVKSGNTFEGWYMDSGFVTPVESTGVLEADVTFYAKFELEE